MFKTSYFIEFSYKMTTYAKELLLRCPKRGRLREVWLHKRVVFKHEVGLERAMTFHISHLLEHKKHVVYFFYMQQPAHGVQNTLIKLISIYDFLTPY